MKKCKMDKKRRHHNIMSKHSAGSTTKIRVTALNTFLAKYNTKSSANEKKNLQATHTSMSGGAYHIPDNKMDEFYQIYYDHVFGINKEMNLTERQHECGPILVDFDFRYDGIVGRQHTIDDVKSIVYIYTEELKSIVELNEGDEFPIYVMEKPSVNPITTTEPNYTKDGIHIIIGIMMDHKYQLILRNRILETIDDAFHHLNTSNGYDKIIDEGICKGCTNWTLYGSCKPHNATYKLTMGYVTTVDKNRDLGVRIMDKDELDDIGTRDNFTKLSARNTSWPHFPINPEIIKQAEKGSKSIRKSSSSSSCISLPSDDDTEYVTDLNDITDRESLDSAVDGLMASLSSREHYIYETHQYTQTLPEKYYDPGSHDLNRKVAFALKNTDNRLFLSWVMLRSKSHDFEYDSIPQLYEKWSKYFNINQR